MSTTRSTQHQHPDPVLVADHGCPADQDAARLLVRLDLSVPRTAAALTALSEALSAIPGAVVTLPRPQTPAGIRIGTASRTVSRDGVPVPLTRLEFDLLAFLCAAPDRVHRRQALLTEVWGGGEHLGDRTVDVHVRRLRGKLGTDPNLITTVRGVGYRFDGLPHVTVEP